MPLSGYQAYLCDHARAGIIIMGCAFIIAGEPSGDKLAAQLMQAAAPDITSWSGIGGPLMAEQGLPASPDYELLHIIGLMDALRNYRKLKGLLARLVDEAARLRPDVIFTIDSKGFSLRFAREIKKRMEAEGWHAPIIHMVAPTIWAYGEGRKHAFEQAFDAMLCLFPMEPELFDQSALKTYFIGHPAAYSIKPKKRFYDEEDVLHLVLLPGSRRSEISKLLPAFLRSAASLQKYNHLQITIATLPHLEDKVRRGCKLIGVKADIVTGQDALNEALDKAQIMMAASGTITLETALSALPGLVGYRLNGMVTQIMKWRFKQPDPILPNIIYGRPIYPFFLNQELDGIKLTAAMTVLLTNYEEMQNKHVAQAKKLQKMLTADAADFQTAIADALISLGIKKGS